MGIITTTQKAGYDSHVIDVTKHRLINDAGTSTTELFSASKIISDLAGKSDTTHNHTGVYEPADATILKDADIGVSVQAYNADNITKANSIKDLADVLTTMTPIDGQVLTYDTTNGWQAETSPVGVTDHTLLTNIGTNTHAQIDTHIADTTVHFTQASISITESQISNLGTTIVLDSDIGSTVQAYDVDTAKLDVLQTFTVAQRSNITTDNDLSFDLAVTNKFKCTPTALGTLTFTNLAAQSGMVILDNTGGYAISLAASIKAKSGVATTLSTAGVYLIGYDCDGTNVYITVSAAMV